MPRTVENLVRNHQLAIRRVRQGKPSWEGELEFMTVLTPLAHRHQGGDPSLTARELLEAFHATAKEVREKVTQAKGDFFNTEDEDLEFFVCELESWTLEFVESHPNIWDAFDEGLARLYDWCDEHRWWVEIPRT